ncbi:MAG: class I SAM-dependent methyltransferase [Filomicrobium sp.]
MSRTSISFEVYNPYSIVQLSEVLQDVTIRSGEAPVYNGKAVVSSLVNTGLMLVVSATLVDNWKDLTFALARSNDLSGEVNRFIEEWEVQKRIRPGYQQAVGDLKSLLSQLSPWLDQVDISAEHEANSVSDDVFGQLRNPLLPKFVELQQRFEEEARAIGDDELAAHRLFAQRDLLPLMMRAPFFHRSYVKPLGYAGDYLMVKMMVEGKRAGPTTYARLINDFYLEIDLVKAHRNRLIIIEDKLNELSAEAAQAGRKLDILNIGCGPAIELIRFIKNSPNCESCRFTLIDFNAETIEYARNAIETAMRDVSRRPQVEFKQLSVHSLLKQSSSDAADKDQADYDFVYCAGLFDYLSDRVCQRLLELFCKWTKPGGNVIATNVHPDNPTRWIMEHVIEWHLIHRTMEDLAQLSPAEHPKRVFDDTTRMNVFVDISVGGES